MAYNADILLGRILKIHGNDGSVAVKLEKFFTENIPYMESVFLENEGRPVPFFLSESEYAGGDTLVLKFQWYDSIEKISEFAGCRVYLTSVPDNPEVPDRFQSIIGYDVMLPDKTKLGTITDVIQNPGQWMLIIHSPDEKEILVPLHDDFIVKFSKRTRSIIMDLPDGLIGLNLSK